MKAANYIWFVILLTIAVFMHPLVARGASMEVFEGQVVPNAAQHQGSATKSVGIAYEDAFTRYPSLHYVVSYVNQGTIKLNGEGQKRDGFTFEVKVPAQLSERFGVAYQVGPYIMDTTHTYANGDYKDSTTVALVQGVSAEFGLTRDFALRARMQRTDLAGGHGGTDGFYFGIVWRH